VLIIDGCIVTFRASIIGLRIVTVGKRLALSINVMFGCGMETTTYSMLF